MPAVFAFIGGIVSAAGAPLLGGLIAGPFIGSQAFIAGAALGFGPLGAAIGIVGQIAISVGPSKVGDLANHGIRPVSVRGSDRSEQTGAQANVG